MTVEMAVMSWAVSTTHAKAPSSPAAMGPASPPTTFVMGRMTAWMDQMRQRAYAAHHNLPAHPNSTCASLESALTSIRCAMGRRTARTTVMKKAVVREMR